MTDISDFDAPKPPAWFGAVIPLILVLLALIVALLALNANTNLMPFIYMIF